LRSLVQIAESKIKFLSNHEEISPFFAVTVLGPKEKEAEESLNLRLNIKRI
jgi:hypothetical protein